MTVGRIPVIEGGIQPTIFDAKADLLTATANDTPARLAVGTNGYVLSPNSGEATGLKWQPVATKRGARVYKTTFQSVANGTQTTMTFDAEFWDSDGFHSNTTNNSRLTIPSGLTGYYQVHGRINFGSNATGARYAILGVNGTSSGNYDAYTVYQAVNGAETMIEVNSIIPLSAGDYVQLFAIQTSGGSLDSLGGQIFYTDFSISLIGV